MAAADEWLTELLGEPGPGVALLAVGAYGRQEPAIGSDLDLVLIHDGKRREKAPSIAEIADHIWYPVWDSGIGLDHSVRTVPEALSVADDDLRAAMGLLDARHIAGDPTLTTALISQMRARWRAKAGTRLPELAEAVAERERAHGEVAFLLEPDLKESRGGLRDITAVRALATAWVADPPRPEVLEAGRVLLDARGELHRRTGRDRLLLQEQQGVADALGYTDAVALARAVAEAGRTVAYAWSTNWYRVARGLKPKRWGGNRRVVRRGLEEGVVEHDGEVTLAVAAKPESDPVLVLRAARAAAVADVPFAPHTLERLANESAPLPIPWPDEAREAFVGMLAAGRPAISVLEALDHSGILVRLLPEWAHVRSTPQRNPYHRFTVDRHLIEAAVNAASLTRSVSRPDLLLVGTLLHDIGKGLPGDHSVVGAELAGRIGESMGFDASDTAALVTIARHHLLLPDTAARRDLDDPATAEFVASVVPDPMVLDLLAAVAEADGRATGPTAWSPWKAQLVAELVRRTKAVLAGGPREEGAASRGFQPTPEQRELMHRAGGQLTVTVEPDTHGGRIIVTGPDQVGLLSAATGVVALHRLDVRRASAAVTSAPESLALLELFVQARHGDDLPSGSRLTRELAAALAGEGRPLSERLTERERAYPTRRPGLPAAPPEVRFEDTLSGSTVVEVRAPDGPGILHRVSEALVKAGLDIRTAIVSTIGADVVDSFYVGHDGDGSLPEGAPRQAVRDAVLQALAPAPQEAPVR
ncbi:MAG: UTP-GlnB [Mycobacterium sp.]|nr:UTP-GlnB [Mycobacterium sp.]